MIYYILTKHNNIYWYNELSIMSRFLENESRYLRPTSRRKRLNTFFYPYWLLDYEIKESWSSRIPLNLNFIIIIFRNIQFDLLHSSYPRRMYFSIHLAQKFTIFPFSKLNIHIFTCLIHFGHKYIKSSGLNTTIFVFQMNTVPIVIFNFLTLENIAHFEQINKF